MSDISPYRLSVELNEAFSSDKCQLECIRRAAACLEEGFESEKLTTCRAEIESLIQKARNVVHMARECKEEFTELRRNLESMDDSDEDDTDDTDKDDTDEDDTDKDDTDKDE